MSLSPSELEYQKLHIGDDLQPNIYAAVCVCLVAAYIAVILRFISRRLAKGGIGKDDIAILVALVWTLI